MRQILVFALVGPSLCGAKMMAPKNVPVDRLITNAYRQVNANPKDFDANFLLARLHSLAYASKAQVPVYYEDPRNASGKFDISMFEGLKGADQWKVSDPLDAPTYEHLRKSYVYYERAVAIDPKRPFGWLGLAYVTEEAGKHIKQTSKMIAGKTMTAQTFESAAVAAYRKIISLETEKAPNFRWGYNDENPKYEAAKNLLAAFKTGLKPMTGEEKTLNEIVKSYEEAPRVMSPIIFSPKNASLESMLTTKTVAFDVAADGLTRTWQWVTPEARILVWDPSGSGKIKDGTQLFGNRTFNMLFKDGYAALAILDNNFDGWLTGKELVGIAVWQDKNVNGVSDSGEVVPISKTGITALRVKSSGTRMNMPMAAIGMKLKSGKTLPTFDWLPTGSPQPRPKFLNELPGFRRSAVRFNPH